MGYLIIAIGAFIYNEIIVCNFYKLNENTWKSIVNKGNIDYQKANENNKLLNEKIRNDRNFVSYEQEPETPDYISESDDY